MQVCRENYELQEGVKGEGAKEKITRCHASLASHARVNMSAPTYACSSYTCSSYAGKQLKLLAVMSCSIIGMSD